LSVALCGDARRALSGSADNTVRLWDVESGGYLRVLEGHTASIWSVALSGDGRRALSGSADDTVRLWDLESGACLRVLTGHTSRVLSVALSDDGNRALSGSDDHTVRLWDLESGGCLCVLKGHISSVVSVALSGDGRRALSGSADHTMRLWDLESGGCLRVLEGHTDSVVSVALSGDGRRALSGSADHTMRLWDVESGGCLRVLEGHTDSVWSVALSGDGRRALSGSADKTVRLWDVESGGCLRVLEGHTDSVWSVALSGDGRRLFSSALNGVLRLWTVDTTTPASHPSPADEQLQYTNAKVMLVGEGGAGKTGLAMRLARKTWAPTASTVGAWATQWELPVESTAGLRREIWLWDFGGQADQRLIHQLYMEETAVAVLVFDPQKDDLFEKLADWDRDLTRAARRPFAKLLAAGRVDLGRLRVSRDELRGFAEKRSFGGDLIETSAATGEGCDQLEKAILGAIRWDELPWRSSPRLFMRLKEEIIRLKDAGKALIQFSELRTTLELSLASEGIRFSDEQLKAVIRLLSGPGVVWELEFGSWVLLKPEILNAYAQVVIQTLRDDPDERGCIVESRVLLGDLRFPPTMDRLESGEERIALLAMHQILVERGLCLRDHDEAQKRPTILTFPSYFRRERPELPTDHPGVLVSYRFKGFLDDIYASLVVRLHHSEPFRQKQLWRYAADFTTATGKRLGLKLTPRADGVGELELYFERGIGDDETVVFATYVHDHLRTKAGEIVRLRHYVCPHCGEAAGNPDLAMKKLAAGKPDMVCVSCENRIPLMDELERRFASPELRERARLMKEQASIALDNESRERALVGEVITTVSLAGQIARELPVDHGIDMEIEFKTDQGEATGRKLYLQLKSGDSHLRIRKEDGAEIFQIHKERHARHWMEQAFPVLLVVRNSKGEVRWMEIRDWLRRESEGGRKPVSQIVFTGERFDVMSVRRWRDTVLARP
jgi:small GTP-binding protein